MNFENAKVILSGYRVIGLKNTDIEKLIKSQESSFAINDSVTKDVPVEPAVNQTMAQSTPVTPVMPEQPSVEVTPEVKVEPVKPEQPQMVSNPTPEPIPSIDPAPAAEAPDEIVTQTGNIFDNPMPSVPPVSSTPVSEPVSTEPAFDEPVLSDNSFSMPAQEPTQTFETPTDFFNKSEIQKPQVATPVEPKLTNIPKFEPTINEPKVEDPALIYLDSIEEIVRNTKEIVEGKNQMIDALNKKVELLTNELNNLKSAKLNNLQTGDTRVLTPNNNINNQAA